MSAETDPEAWHDRRLPVAGVLVPASGARVLPGDEQRSTTVAGGLR
ncbi:MAG: hypothetical protein JXA83_16110 [Acidimicrobiales bacterium]|nr:hypothetical protein [Acidimicrobiales bacterium]